MKISSRDRNFDEISEHFEKKIYGGLKGEIRLAVLRHDIFGWVKSWQQTHNRPLRVLDVGAGLAQISIELAKDGHDVTINDISANMLEIAKQNAGEAAQNITWHTCPYQQLDDKLTGKYDLILCHAVLEWLAEPKLIMDFFDRWLVDDGAETLAQNIIGLLVGFVILRCFGLDTLESIHLQAVIFVASYVRGYVIRRCFNKWQGGGNGQET